MVLTAPRSGVVMAADETAGPGTTVARGQELLLLAASDAWEIHALAESDDFSRLALNQAARFLPEDPGFSVVSCIVHRLDSYADRVLEWPLLADVHGGQIGTTRQDALTMRSPRHRVLCVPEGRVFAQTRVRGVVTVRVWTESLTLRGWVGLRALWERELGF